MYETPNKNGFHQQWLYYPVYVIADSVFIFLANPAIVLEYLSMFKLVLKLQEYLFNERVAYCNYIMDNELRNTITSYCGESD